MKIGRLFKFGLMTNSCVTTHPLAIGCLGLHEIEDKENPLILELQKHWSL